MLDSSDDHRKNVTIFDKIIKSRQTSGRSKKRAVVLDLFSGIGGGIVALKRVGISMKRVIIVEQDKVAQHVTRHHHDLCYNFNPDVLADMTDAESVEFISIPTMEELQAELDGDNTSDKTNWLERIGSEYTHLVPSIV